jgi:hypothetical protein
VQETARDVAGADPQAGTAMAIRAVLTTALEELGESDDARAITALFAGPGELRGRETAAAEIVGRAWDTYRRKVATQVLPRLAEAVLQVERRGLEETGGRAPAIGVRRDHPRIERILERATESVIVSGINLEAVVSCVSTVTELARRGVEVRLLALDPRGRVLVPFSQFSGVEPDVRRNKINSNLRHLAPHVLRARGRIELHVTDAFFATGCIGVDMHLPSGMLVIQHYLTGTGADQSPVVHVTRTRHREWYDVYERQLEATWRQSNAYARSPSLEPARPASERRARLVVK